MAKQPRKGLTWEQIQLAKKILSHLASPPKCICGSRQFGFSVWKYGLRARCEKCGADYYYLDSKRSWSRRPPKHQRHKS